VGDDEKVKTWLSIFGVKMTDDEAALYNTTGYWDLPVHSADEDEDDNDDADDDNDDDDDDEAEAERDITSEFDDGEEELVPAAVGHEDDQGDDDDGEPARTASDLSKDLAKAQKKLDESEPDDDGDDDTGPLKPPQLDKLFEGVNEKIAAQKRNIHRMVQDQEIEGDKRKIETFERSRDMMKKADAVLRTEDAQEPTEPPSLKD